MDDIYFMFTMKPKTSPLVYPISHAAISKRFPLPGPIGTGPKQMGYPVRWKWLRAKHRDTTGKISSGQGSHKVRGISELAVRYRVPVHAPVDSKMYFRDGRPALSNHANEPIK
jgi:hypothetical protein